MKFLDNNFLLQSSTAENLFHNYAKNQPIIDYHCHLSPQEIAEDKKFSSISELWLGSDHYKWRAMRSAGISEEDITGDSVDERTKFQHWSETLVLCIGNPLYQWTHLELQRYFNITKPLSGDTAEEIWNTCNEQIAGETFSAQGLISRSNVEIICTTDDPVDDLQWHKKIHALDNFKTKVYPTFRPDKIINIDKDDFVNYIDRLSEASHVVIKNFEDLKEVVDQRIAFFHEQGCRLSDHALLSPPKLGRVRGEKEADNILQKKLRGEILTQEEVETFQFEFIVFLGRAYQKRKWTMQLHIGALRDVNIKMFNTLGPDTGFDVISDEPIAKGLSQLLGTMELNDALPKTILYNLNPSNNFILATMMGAFQASEDFDFGKMQFGSGWWHNDQKDGIERQLIDLGNLGVLGKFIGMLTDSRSFLSYPRHEYFRRIFCNLIGNWVENGEYPHDELMLKKIVEGVCYYNVKEFLNF